MIDVSEHISAVDRRVGTRVLPAGETRVVTVTRTYAAPVDDVWDACTNPERLPRWFAPVTGELRVGGRYQVEGNAGGTVERCDPPGAADVVGFAATWEFGGGVTGVEVRLTPASGGGTVLTLEHVGLDADDHWAEFGPGAVGIGWEMGLLGLAGHLGAPGVPTPDRADEWYATDGYREFGRGSSDAWCAAHAASGADPEQARAAADRTTAAYTAVPEDAAAGRAPDAS